MYLRLTGDRGSVGGVEAVPFGVLTFVVGSLLVANAWAVVDVKLAVTSASREATRRYVEAPSAERAHTDAIQAAQDVVRAHGRAPERVRVHVQHDGDRSWGRCTRVAVQLSYPVPALTLPWIGGYGDAFDVRAEHSEIVDPFRAGLAGVAEC